MRKTILDHYAAGVELNRLRRGGGYIEFVRTQQILKDHLPRPPSRILDVGGGPGAYSVWLAGLGHRVHLVDPVPLHVRQARAAAGGKTGLSFTAEVGDAHSINSSSNAYDVVLMMGPLYHLTKRAERIMALTEGYRVLRPRGVLFAAGISRFASLVDGLRYKFLKDPVFRRIVSRDLRTGQHRNPTDKEDYFTTSFFHRPNELAREIEDAGFDLKHIFAVEGPASMLPLRDSIAILKDKETASHVLRSLASVEKEPSLLGISSHMLAFAVKPSPQPHPAPY